jgi:circadian clock protein KaiB
MTEEPKDMSGDFDNAVAQKSQATYLLRLYVSGTTPRSVRAISNIKQICQERLKGRFELEVIDTYQKPKMVKKKQIVALPTLIKELPPPLRRLVGDLSNTERVLVKLDLIENK